MATHNVLIRPIAALTLAGEEQEVIASMVISLLRNLTAEERIDYTRTSAGCSFALATHYAASVLSTTYP